MEPWAGGLQEKHIKELYVSFQTWARGIINDCRYKKINKQQKAITKPNKKLNINRVYILALNHLEKYRFR